MKLDKEIDFYRSLLTTPSEFKDGFNWMTVAGIFFCGLVMMPGAIYLGLMTGGNMGSAASWVTVILFMEISRRALQPLKKQNLVVLLQAASIMMAGSLGPIAQLVYRAYFVGSDAVRDAGMRGCFPKWFAPSFDSPAITERMLFHKDWIIPIVLVVFMLVVSLVNRYTLGYFFFRLTSDVERLPFPLAPIQAQGSLAMAEADQSTEPDATGGVAGSENKPAKSPRWRIFTLGAYLGIAFGLVQVGIPVITGLLLSKPFFLIPQPFIDTTTLTERLLPATPTGLTCSLDIILIGFILPFWSVVGTFCAIVLTVFLNPLLHHLGILNTWQPGMDTVNTTFSNSVDFWMSFQIGIGFAIAAVSIYATSRDVASKLKAIKIASATSKEKRNLWTPPVVGRGDYPIWIALVVYVLTAISLIFVTYRLVPDVPGIVFFMIFFTLFYNPLISYVTARLLGISGQQVDIPMVKEIAFLASGTKGIEIWLAPVPVENYGYHAQAFRVNELTGVSFWSLMKTDACALPVMFILSLLYWGFIWNSNAVPSDMFPATQVTWELQAKNTVLYYSSTFVAPGEKPEGKNVFDSEFMRAIHPKTIATGFCGITLLYAVLSGFGFPIMFVYGLLRGFGNLPHTMLLEIVGAMLGRFYFRKKYGAENFMRLAPILVAGYFTGVGLISMASIALRLISTAVSAAPF